MSATLPLVTISTALFVGEENGSFLIQRLRAAAPDGGPNAAAAPPLRVWARPICTCSSRENLLHGQQLDDPTGALVERGASQSRHRDPLAAVTTLAGALRPLADALDLVRQGLGLSG